MTRFILDAFIAIKWVLPETDSLQTLPLAEQELCSIVTADQRLIQGAAGHAVIRLTDL